MKIMINIFSIQEDIYFKRYEFLTSENKIIFKYEISTELRKSQFFGELNARKELAKEPKTFDVDFSEFIEQNNVDVQKA